MMMKTVRLFVKQNINFVKTCTNHSRDLILIHVSRKGKINLELKFWRTFV